MPRFNHERFNEGLFDGQETVTLNRYSYAGSGGLTFAGGATRVRTKRHSIPPPGDGIRLGGASPYTAYIRYYVVQTYAPSGGMTLSGTAAAAALLQHPYAAASGGLTLGGTAAVAATKAYAASGGMELFGAADPEHIWPAIDGTLRQLPVPVATLHQSPTPEATLTLTRG